jgi:transcriptional regulator with XRE-family HTH domain
MSTEYKERRANMDLKYLNDKINEIKIPITSIAEKMGVSRQTLYLKMNGHREFKTSEIEKLCEILRLTNDEKSLIFFADRVDKNVN